MNHHWLLIGISNISLMYAEEHLRLKHLLKGVLNDSLKIECTAKLTENYPAPGYDQGFQLVQERNFYFLGSKGVDEGLTSLYLHCLGIETMPVHRQHNPFESILYEIAVSFSSSSLKRHTALAGIEYHKTYAK